MCWNQGDWRFYKYYKEWQWKTYVIAKEIIQQHHIDIVHQLNMIGFREPGYLWKLGIPYLWGPIGGSNKTNVILQKHTSLLAQFKLTICLGTNRRKRKLSHALFKRCQLKNETIHTIEKRNYQIPT